MKKKTNELTESMIKSWQSRIEEVLSEEIESDLLVETCKLAGASLPMDQVVAIDNDGSKTLVWVFWNKVIILTQAKNKILELSYEKEWDSGAIPAGYVRIDNSIYRIKDVINMYETPARFLKAICPVQVRDTEVTYKIEVSGEEVQQVKLRSLDKTVKKILQSRKPTQKVVVISPMGYRTIYPAY